MPPKLAMLLAGAVVLATQSLGRAQDNSRMSSSAEEQNRTFINAAFERWSRGEGDVFTLLAEDATWQIVGADPEVAKTYDSRDALLAAAARPLAARLKTPLKPSVRKVWADGDDVLVHWDGRAELINGTSYENSYMWIMTVKGQRIVAVTAFLDIPAFKAALASPPRAD
ncbi:nuclear transport factor 2 family protein [Bradyrhizobium sp. MOS003]|uniref:nuclear transport factor 2 family protein n=1 Tax=Bradyrhizobium sp. MOS003 TaxID=2133946 RepID=UPI000D12F38D|nr:nuclear transport factor 2 family protein [Bradyrhizobium sp. MOS003]PSO15708.1 ketosteroid isomerase [Bradyrhizobium sp. MOS003]